MASGLVRSKGFDATSRVIYPSQTLRLDLTQSDFASVSPVDYVTPSDRIARYINPSSAGLTMKKAVRVAKAMEKHPNTLRASGKVSLAPDVMLASSRISEMASTTTPSVGPKRTHPPAGVAADVAIEVPSSRINARPRNKIIIPTSTKKPSQALDLDAWDPEPISSGEEDPLERVSQPLMAQRLQDMIKRILNEGVPSSSARNVPVPQLTAHMLDRILARLQFLSTLESSIEIESLLKAELSLVEQGYSYSAARASAECLLLDPLEARNAGINLAKAKDQTAYNSWVTVDYQVREWRVLRMTGVNAKELSRVKKLCQRIICSSLPIMLTIQATWLNSSPPSSWWEDMKASNRHSYSAFLFTDLSDSAFRSRLPLTLAEFLSHIDVYSKGIREGLTEFWLTEVGNKLHEHVASLSPGDCKAAINDEYASEVQDRLEAELSVESGSAVDENSLEQLASKALDQRLKFELPQPKQAAGNTVSDQPISHQNMKSRSKAARLIDAAAVLLSRQLRSISESSLKSFSDLFERLNNPISADYAVFVINIRVRKVSTKEVTSDFSAPVEVCLQPDISEIKAAMGQCVNIILAAGKDFQRPENLSIYGTGFGGQNHAFIADYLNANHHRRLNSCMMSRKDEVVVDTIARINAAVEKFFQGPHFLLNKFSSVEELLSGAVAERIMAVIENSKTCEDPLDGIEMLNAVCKELELLIEKIRDVLPDVIFFSAFEVKCSELKESLIRYVRGLHNHVVEIVVVENREHMSLLNTEYQVIAGTLDTRPINAVELKELVAFTNKAAFTLIDLSDQYKGLCFERVKFLLNNKHKLSREDVTTLITTHSWPLNIDIYLRKSYEQQTECKRELEELLAEDQRNLESDITDVFKRIDVLAEQQSTQDFKRNCNRAAEIRKDLENLQVAADEVTERETLLDIGHGEHQQRIQEAVVALDPVERFWTTARNFYEKKRVWLESNIVDIDAEDVDRSADEFFRVFVKIGKEFDRLGEKRLTGKRLAEALQKDVKEFQVVNVPLMLLVCNPGMKDRHWLNIEKITGITVPLGVPLNTSTLVNLGLQNYVKEIEETCVAASKEYSLGMSLNKMEEEWKKMNFETKEYRTSGTRILCSVDEIQQLLDDQIVKIQAMRGSRYIKPFAEQVSNWESTLISMQDTLDNWLKVQATWLYLEPIFSSEDIMRQMPTEGTMFRAVDSTWRVSMAQTYEQPSCVAVARRPGFLNSLIEANKKLEIIQKGLNDYLETKRLSFPRFFFLSNDELLEILAETKDPLRVQPHLKKCFDGMAKLHFQQNLDIVACYDPTGERLEFPYEKVNHRMINPNESGGNVERWLIEVETMMKKSLAYAIDVSMQDFLEADRIEWLQLWQGQVVICINQTNWCAQVEKTLYELDKGGRPLRDYSMNLCDELMRTVELVRGDIPKALRVSIGALVVMDVHNRDTVHEMVELGVTSKTSFDWLSQLRYYWDSSGYSAQSGLPGTVECRMINALALYAYEYIGNQDRLVITPLTDRCYRTLMGAIHLNLGGAPEGPAGTGKTETTKDLAKAIAIQCVVTNCSDGLDYLAMAKFFKGLAASGAWACFDEFNRIQLEVLSVIAQQIMQIQQGKLKGLERFVFEGTELPLKPTCCPFM